MDSSSGEDNCGGISSPESVSTSLASKSSLVAASISSCLMEDEGADGRSMEPLCFGSNLGDAEYSDEDDDDGEALAGFEAFAIFPSSSSLAKTGRVLFTLFGCVVYILCKGL